MCDGFADVAELADALDSGSSDSNVIWVQVPSSAPKAAEHSFCSFFVCGGAGVCRLTGWGERSDRGRETAGC